MAERAAKVASGVGRMAVIRVVTRGQSITAMAFEEMDVSFKQASIGGGPSQKGGGFALLGRPCGGS